MKEYYHSIRQDPDKCKGCVHCLQQCPTQAIRVRDGKGYIIEEKCIDCGECFRACSNRAKIVNTDTLNAFRKFSHVVALPPPAFFVQFPPEVKREQLLAGLRILGFDSIFEVSVAAELAADEINRFLNESGMDRPVLSSSCPAVVRMIQVTFPELVNQIVPIDSPEDIAAFLAKRHLSQKLGLDPDQIGVFFLTSCSAKVTSFRSPEGRESSPVDGSISISNIYGPLLKLIGKIDTGNQVEGLITPPPTGFGLGWGVAGGEPMGIGLPDCLSVSGIHNVMQVLEELELGKINGLDYIECHACYGGCVGGILNVQNRFLAEVKLKKLINEFPPPEESIYQRLGDILPPGFKAKILNIEGRPVKGLDDDISRAVEKMNRMDEISSRLPGLDCGACGSPTCDSLAEDVIQGLAEETDCVFSLLENIEEISTRINDLAEIIPPVIRNKYKNRLEGEKDDEC